MFINCHKSRPLQLNITSLYYSNYTTVSLHAASELQLFRALHMHQ